MVVSKMNKDAQMRAAINQKLIETGERERPYPQVAEISSSKFTFHQLRVPISAKSLT
uniref:ENY2 transcription and export complex 2 subunit n=2 Tax=Mus musculus TaxID=10090 RepID=A0A2I3BQ37_MOUSE